MLLVPKNETLRTIFMNSSNQILGDNHKKNNFSMSGYFKSDLPSDESFENIDMRIFCKCGNSKNKPFCDESHKKCFLNSCNPWF